MPARPHQPPVTNLPIDLGPGRGRPRASHQTVTWEFIRSLTSEDIQTLVEAPRQKLGEASLQKIRHVHHQLAQLLAQGAPVAEAALITGYTPQYIYVLQRDPTFGELLEHYGAERQQVFVDTLERMKSLGLSTLDELQLRLEEEPEKWSRRELMEMAELMLVKPMTASRGALVPGMNGAGPGVNVQVNFVTANPTIDLKAE